MITAEDVRRGYVGPKTVRHNGPTIDQGSDPLAKPNGLLDKVLNNEYVQKAKRYVMYGESDWSNEANKVGKELGINPNILLAGGKETIEKAIEINNDRKRMQDTSAFIQAYPEINNIQYKSTADAIEVLNHAENVKATRGIFDALQQGIWSMNDQMKLSEQGYKLMAEKDEGKRNEIMKEINRLQRNLESYRTGGDFIDTVVHDTAGQVYMMGKQYVEGAVERGAEGMATGATAGALLGSSAGSVVPVAGTGFGAAAGATAGALSGLNIAAQAGMAEQMYKMSAGLKYLELLHAKDSNGKNIYTPQEAANRAASIAVVDAGIEFGATKLGLKAIRGVAPGVIGSLKGLGEAGIFSTFGKGIGATIAQTIKSGIKSGSAELAEEGLQDINEKVQRNAFGKKGDITYSLGDIAVGSFDAMKQALPAVLGMSILGGVGSGAMTIKNYRQFKALPTEMQQMIVQEEVNRKANATLNNIVEEAKTSTLATNNPELFSKIVQAQGERTGLSTVYVNAHEAIETEEGQRAIQSLVDKGVITQEEVTKAIENDVALELPIGQFAQMATDLDSNSIEELQKVSYYTEGGKSLKAIEKEKQSIDAIKKKLQIAHERKTKMLKDDMLAEFDEHEQDLVANILDENPFDLVNTYKSQYNQMETEFGQKYNGEIEEAKKELGSSASIENIVSHINNKFTGLNSKEYGSVRALNESPYADIIKDSQDLITMTGIKTKIDNLYKGDLIARTYLSESGYKVYKQLREKMEVDTGNNIYAQAGHGALLFASHADVMASIMREAGSSNYTAEDYMKDYIELQVGGTYSNQSGLRQGYEKNLIAYHNISADNLAKSLDLGGLPVPSIAITHKDNDYTDFGEISLIMKPDVVAPNTTPVFSRDAWTTTFPTIYRKGKKSKIVKYSKNVIMAFRKKYTDLNFLDFGNLYTDSIAANADTSTSELQNIVEGFLNRSGAKYLFLQEIGDTPTLEDRKVSMKASYPFRDNVNELEEKLIALDEKYKEQGGLKSLPIPPKEGSEWEKDYKEFQTFVKGKIEEHPAKFKQVINDAIKRVDDGSYFQEAVKAFGEKDGSVSDKEGFLKSIDKKIQEHQEAFVKWQEKFKDEMLSEPRLQDNDAQINLDNIVEAMVASIADVANQQKTMFGTGHGNVIASTGHQFNDLDEMHLHADTYISVNLTEEEKEQIKQKYDEVRNRITDFVNKMSAYGMSEAPFQLLVDLAKGDKSFKQLAKKHGLKYSQNLETEAKKILTDIKEMPVEYFEAKPQRAVGFDEVAAAIIPKDTDTILKGKLKEKGVKVIEYDATKDSDRTKAIQKAQQSNNVLFQESGQENSPATLAEQKLANDEKAFSYIIDNLNTLKSNKAIRVMETPIIMQLIGAKALPIVMHPSKIKKIMVKHPSMTASMLKQIPRKLTDPIAVFESKSVPGRIVVVLDLVDKQTNANVIVPIELNISVDRYNANVILSAYRKADKQQVGPQISWFTDYFENKLSNKALYLNNKKITNWYKGNRLQLPYRSYRISDFFSYKIPNETDLVKYKSSLNNKYYQNMTGKNVRGLTSLMANDKKIIQLFSHANFSTFVHESGHVFLEDLQMLAKMDNAPKQVIEDWNTIKEWTGYKEGASADENRAAHEKFAKGFEAYIREGEAPIGELRRVFRQFAKWLTKLYDSVMELGGLPSQEVQDVMARMLATQESIDNWSVERRLGEFETSDYMSELTEEEIAKLNNYVSNVREGAKEKVLKAFMKEVDGAKEKLWKQKKEIIQEQIAKELQAQHKAYEVRAVYNELGDVALLNTPYETLADLEKAEKEVGALYKKAVANEMKKAKEEFMATDLTDEDLVRMADEYILSDEGQAILVEEEAKAIKKQTNKAVAETYKKIQKLNSLDMNSETLVDDLKSISDSEIFVKAIERLKKENADKAKEISKLKEALQAEMRKARALKEFTIPNHKAFMEQARIELNGMRLGQATSFKTFQNKVISEGRKADVAISKGDLKTALEAKHRQMLFIAMSRAAYENNVAVNKALKDLKKKTDAITRPQKPLLIEPNARYFMARMMYKLKLTERAPIEPLEGFDMDSLMAILDPDAMLSGNRSIYSLSQNVMDVFENEVSYKQLTFEQFDEIVELLKGVYASGRNAYEGTKILNERGKHIGFDAAAKELVDAGKENVVPASENLISVDNNQGWADATKQALHSKLLQLTKIETILRRLDGGKPGVWTRYIYEPINRATNHGKILLEEATKTLHSLTSIYSKDELHVIRNKRLYDIGDVRGLTKEQVMVLALNWGTEANRQRVKETVNANETEIEKAFAMVLTDKDWQFIEGTWALINSYFEERSAVQERIYGSPLKKEKGVAFTINGREIQGQYYPIVYDARMDATSKDYETEDIIKSQLSSSAVWGMGMSATKQRMAVVKGKKLMLSFNVIPRAIDEAVNHIAMREAATDVNKLLNNRMVANYLMNALGPDATQMLKAWVRDNWQAEITKTTAFDRAIMRLKSNTSFAVMAYRTSTAVLNWLNVFPMMKELGGVRGGGLIKTTIAIRSFYGYNPSTFLANREFVKEHSIFMRERLHNLDKDLQKGLSIDGDGLDYFGNEKAKEVISKSKAKAGDIKDFVNNYAYQFITETDLMISMPLWKYEYERTVREMNDKGITDLDLIEQEAVSAGDRAVRRVFGSGDTKDTVEVQRRKGIISLFTPFYTYCNTVLNALIEAGYAVKDRNDYGTLINTILFWIVIQGVGEGMTRALISGDTDDPNKLMKKIFGTTVSNVVGGLPVIRDGVAIAMDTMLGERSYSKGNEVLALDILPKLYNLMKSVSSDKKDWIDIGRDVSAVSNRMIGFSDTLTDGFWTLMRWTATDTDATVYDLIKAIAFDKKINKK